MKAITTGSVVVGIALGAAWLASAAPIPAFASTFLIQEDPPEFSIKKIRDGYASCGKSEGELSDPGLAGECCFRFTLTGVEGEEQPNPVPGEPPINVLGYLVTYRQFTHTVGNCEYKPGSICDLPDWIVEKGGTCHTFA